MANEYRKDKLLSRSIRFLNCGKISLPLIFLLVFLFSIAIAPAAFALEGYGTEDDPYLIANQSDLEEFRDIVNGAGNYSENRNSSAHAKLTADITLTGNWTPIGNSSSSQYTGTFDGDGYTISELSVSGTSYLGFFGYVGTDGVVKNLTIGSGTVSGTSSCVGGIVSWNSGAVLSCTNSGDVSGGRYVGGIVGWNSGAVQNCTNSGDVSGDSYVGGIAGRNSSTVQNCINSGKVSSNYNYDDYVGGIVGDNYDTVQNCGYLETSANSGIGNNNGNSENVGSFSPDEAQIAVTLSASIADSAIAADGETTITLTTQPGTWADVMNAGGLEEISTSTSNDIVTITTDNDNGTVTVKGDGISTGETTIITVKTVLYTYNYSSGEYDKNSTAATTYEFNFDLTVGDVADEDTGGEDDNGDDSSSTESGGASGGSGGAGCNAGTGALALLALIPLALRRKR